MLDISHLERITHSKGFGHLALLETANGGVVDRSQRPVAAQYVVTYACQ
jgi:hypothetical protein